jgi:hypothetical protein
VILLPLLSSAPEPAGDVREDTDEELPVSNPTAALMQMLVSTLSLKRWRIGSLQFRNETSDAELVADGGGCGDVGDDGSSSRDHR